MKRILSLVAVCCLLMIAYNSNAQVAEVKPDTLWRKGGFAALNFNQASFTNWAQGGDNSMGLSSLFSAFAKYKSHDSTFRWENSIDLAYGLLITGDQTRKTDDKIDLLSKAGKKAFDHIFYTGLVEFKSQFTNGYNYPDDSTVVSKFLAPAYLLISLGMDWKPVDYFSLYVSPATGRFTFVSDSKLADAGAYGVDPAVYVLDSLGAPTGVVAKHGKKVRFEFGAYISAKFQKDIVKNVNFKSKLDLFDNYTDKVASNRKNVDVSWENNLVMKVNKYISASVFTNLVYDDDIPHIDKNGVKHGPRIQFKEILGIGFSVKF